MCGISGFWDISKSWKTEQLDQISRKMSDTLYHRGPDDGGTWSDVTAGITLGHRRLSIVDLSPEGHQPMHSANDRYVIVFNGEIYNFGELRKELSQLGYGFRGHSDTEVMLASFCEWGLERSLQRFNGMFAFALWDRETQQIHLARDRFGEKPLYYGWVGNTLIFASELKAIKAHPAFQGEVNRDALELFLRYSYVPSPCSIYQGIQKLPPGTLLSWNGNASHPTPQAYWAARSVIETSLKNPFTGTETEATDQLEALLKDAVGMRMVADVPLGAFLSGGIDSSTIVALMQAQSTQPVKTFTMGFHEGEYNEAEHAKAVAKHLGTDHTELYVTPEDALSVIPKLPALYDEPFSDSSQIPTFMVSQLAKQKVTVSLSGDAGDELFTGYNRYVRGRQIWNKISPFPLALRQTIAQVLPGRSRRFRSIAEILRSPNPEGMYDHLVSTWRDPSEVVLNFSNAQSLLSNPSHWATVPNFTHHMMYMDTMTYLPDDILVKVDRASMGASLESRVPFLDHRLLEFAWRLPLSMNLSEGKGKQLLRKVLYRHVPQELVDRPKTGFGVPIETWLRGPLRDWAEDLLDERRLKEQGFFNPVPIRQKWKEQQQGISNWDGHLWSILMFQAWHDANH